MCMSTTHESFELAVLVPTHLEGNLPATPAPPALDDQQLLAIEGKNQEKMQQNADMFRLRVVAQLRELSCKPCFAHVLRKTPTSRKNSASAALTTFWEGGPKRPHLPNSHSSQQPEEARFAPCRSPVRHLKIIRAADNPTPDFHNAMSTSNCATRPTPDVKHFGKGCHQTSAPPPQGIQDGSRGCQAPDPFIYHHRLL